MVKWLHTGLNHNTCEVIFLDFHFLGDKMILMVFACSIKNFLQREEAVQQVGDVAEQ